MLASTDAIDERLAFIGAQPFRAKFQLRGRERGLVQLRGAPAIRQHARELIAKRLAPAAPDEYAVDVICRWIERELEQA